MDDRALLRTGVAGSVLAALCCFTPVLALVLGVLGLSAWLGWADYVLLPLLALCLALTGFALWRLRRRRAAAEAAACRGPPERRPGSSPAP